MKVLLLLLCFASCSLSLVGNDAPKSAKHSSYSISFSSPGWESKQENRSDYVFQHSDGRILLSNSFCEEFQEQQLERLAEKTFKTVGEFQKESGTYVTFKDREAYRLEGKGLVDGVKVSLLLVNTRRNNCYFDFLAISPDGTLQDVAPFEKFLSSVVFR
jgi:hypothetical protein